MHEKSSNATRSLTAGAAVVIVILTAAAFWLSYEHLHDVAAANGLTGIRAWAWPATVDLFIVAGELLFLRAALRATRDPWAIGVTATGSLGSIALNVAGVGSDATLLQYVVAAVPPSAALIAFGVLMKQIHERLKEQPATQAEKDATQGATAPDLPVYPPALQPATPVQQPATELEEAVAEALRPVAEDTENVDFLTTAEVAKIKDVAPATVRSWVARNKLTPVQRDGDARLLFHPLTVAALD